MTIHTYSETDLARMALHQHRADGLISQKEYEAELQRLNVQDNPGARAAPILGWLLILLAIAFLLGMLFAAYLAARAAL